MIPCPGWGDSMLTNLKSAHRASLRQPNARCRLADVAEWRTLGSLGTIGTKSPLPDLAPAIIGPLNEFFDRTELGWRVLTRPVPSESSRNVCRG